MRRSSFETAVSRPARTNATTKTSKRKLAYTPKHTRRLTASFFDELSCLTLLIWIWVKVSQNAKIQTLNCNCLFPVSSSQDALNGAIRTTATRHTIYSRTKWTSWCSFCSCRWSCSICPRDCRFSRSWTSVEQDDRLYGEFSLASAARPTDHVRIVSKVMIQTLSCWNHAYSTDQKFWFRIDPNQSEQI